MSQDIAAFQEKLENNHEFPGSYSFKFIVKQEHQPKVEALVPGGDIKLKPSSGNTYVSVTIKAHMQSSLDVVSVYQEAKKIEGIISL
ncbi:MAG: hypothetical protein Tsb0034_28950 [Ekhidna sp.]